MAEACTTPVRLLHEFFERTARRFPDRVAVDVPPGPGRPERRRVTYRALREQADALAETLRRQGLRPDDVVAVLLARNSHLIYAAQLAVLKAGAAFTCIDPVFPDESVRAILDDGDVAVVLSDRDGSGRIGRLCPRARVVDVTEPTEAPAERDARGATPTAGSLAYVIYTSGTTGLPKGVMIEHRSVVNLVASDIDEFGLTPDDRVGQGSSAAYDSSVEEIWLAFAAGAALVLMDDDTVRLGPDLVPWLRRERISVFCPPPTLLRTTGCADPAGELPDLRLLYVGGEALTEDLVNLWARGRRMVNGYGPTECTVTVVRGDVVPGGPVTIGRPVPGHSAFVLDSELRPVIDGEAGELCLAGAGLARGYRDGITREKFPVHPEFGRIYRTGDLVRRAADGDLFYLGRIDAQVKLRGYRIELEAIEASLGRCGGVREAACRVQGEGSGALLAAHIVPMDADAPPVFDALKEALRRTLPPYMVPARFAHIGSLPRTVGGKVDRRSLREIGPDRGETGRAGAPPRSDLETTIVAAFTAALRLERPASIDGDFFLDLGGDSLSAVGVVCALRAHAGTESITTRDVYEARTAERLAARLGARPTQRPVTRSREEIPRGHVARPFLVTIAQAAWLLTGMCVLSAAAWLIAFELIPWLLERFGIAGTLLMEVPLVLAGMVGYSAFSIAFAVVVKRVLIGRYAPVRTPVWSGYFLRHWIVQSAARAIPWSMLAGTVAYGAVLRLLGARVGRRVHIARGVNLQLGGWDLLTLGDDVTLSRDVHLGLVELDAGCVSIGPVEIQDSATLDIRAGVSADTVVGRGAFLGALSWLPAGEKIPPGERWDGVPAAPAGAAPAAPLVDSGGSLRPAVHAAAQLTAHALTRACNVIPLLAAISLVAALFGTTAADAVAWLTDPVWSPWASVAALAAAVVFVPVWLVVRALGVRAVGRVRGSIISVWSLASIRVWHKMTEVESAGTWLSGTLFWPLWLRLAGADIGRGCEISTIIDVVPENLRVGPGSFLADGIYLGGPRVHRGTVTVCETSLGRGTFLGNHVVVPAGSSLPDDLFIGVCTVADPAGWRAGSSWFGHPPLELPKRDVVGMDRRLTHDPGPLRYATRLSWETLRFALPVLPLVVLSGWLWIASRGEMGGAMEPLLRAPAATLGAVAVMCAVVVALKWLLLGRARAGQHPLWSCWCSRWDFLYVAWQFYALGAMTVLEGTLFLAMYLRAMGVRIGRRVVLGPGMGQLADPDMIVIEDDATVSANYQAHSFEDRVLKLAPVVVRRGATIGESAVLFYGADIGDGAWVAPNSVVMKNERLLPGGSYCGCPVQSLGESGDDSAAATMEGGRWARREEAVTPEGRSPALDIARGLAVVGMIFMHLVPAEASGEGTSLESTFVAVSGLLEGKSAALFCVLAGIAWEIQARRDPETRRSRWYFFRRAASLAVAGVVLHLLAWPTEILVPFALMMTAAMVLRRLGKGALWGALLLVLLLAPAVPALLGQFVEVDWNEDGSHAADAELGWATVRYLLVDGNYPLIPWLAFPLAGMLTMARGWADPRRCRRWFVGSGVVWLLSQAWVLWANANGEALGELSPYLTSTWVPTSLAFVAVTGGWSLAVIAGLAWWQGSRPAAGVSGVVGLLGRSSLTHYLLHVFLVYIPMRAIIGNEEWSAGVGVWAFVAYLVVAVPATVLWFRRFRRGPVEGLWALASGR